MNTDFYALYQKYSNVALLKIVQNEGNYQPSAVEAAASLLKEREISDNERDEATQFLHDIELKEVAKYKKINALQAKVAEVLQPVINPGEEITPQKWLNVLLLVIAVHYIYLLYVSIRYIVFCFNYHLSIFDAFLIINILTIIYIPVIFYLLFKRRKWGWIMLFADNIFVVTQLLLTIYNFSGTANVPLLVIQLIVRLLFIYFMQSPAIAGHFNIPQKTKINTVIIAVCVSAVLFAGQTYPW